MHKRVLFSALALVVFATSTQAVEIVNRRDLLGRQVTGKSSYSHRFDAAETTAIIMPGYTAADADASGNTGNVFLIEEIMVSAGETAGTVVLFDATTTSVDGLSVTVIGYDMD